MKECISAIEAAGLRNGLKILIGGGPCDQTTADYVGADAYCRTAQDCVEHAKSLVQGRQATDPDRTHTPGLALHSVGNRQT